MIYQPGLSVMNQLVARAAAVTGFEADQIRGRDPYKAVCHIRFAIMARARAAGLSLTRIGNGLDGRDHSTIINGLRRAEALRADPDFAGLVEALSA